MASRVTRRVGSGDFPQLRLRAARGRTVEPLDGVSLHASPAAD